MSEKTPNQKPEVDEEDAKTMQLTRGFRLQKHNIIQQLICQKLFGSTFASLPSKIIAHAYSAAEMTVAMLQNRKEKAEFDVELLNRIYKVNSAFSSAVSFKDKSRNHVVVIPFGFDWTEETFESYIKPWSVPLSHYPHYIKYNRCSAYRVKHRHRLILSSVGEKCKHVFMVLRDKDLDNEEYAKKIEEKVNMEIVGKCCPGCGKIVKKDDIYFEETTVVDTDRYWSFFFEASQYLTEAGFESLRNAFEGYALPIMEQVKLEICTHVNPQTYYDVMQLFLKSGGVKEPEPNGPHVNPS